LARNSNTFWPLEWWLVGACSSLPGDKKRPVPKPALSSLLTKLGNHLIGYLLTEKTT
jgi:hypothetical protein